MGFRNLQEKLEKSIFKLNYIDLNVSPVLAKNSMKKKLKREKRLECYKLVKKVRIRKKRYKAVESHKRRIR